MSSETVSKTVIEVDRHTHQRLKAEAKRAGTSAKRLASIALDYAIGKIESGEVSLVEPQLKESAAR